MSIMHPFLEETEGIGTLQVETQGGTQTLLPVKGLVTRTPLDRFGQVVTTGDNSRRSDLSTPEVIATDQRLGSGRYRYEEVDGIEDFTDSQCDTRFERTIVLQPGRTALNATINPRRFAEFIGVTNCRWLAWGPSQDPYRFDGTNWNVINDTVPAAITGVTGFARYQDRYVLASNISAKSYYYGTDGIAWTPAAIAKALYGVCVHDNKCYFFNATDSVLAWTNDITAAYATWSASTAFRTMPNEIVYQLIEWKIPGTPRPAVYLLTTHRILWYDDESDAFTQFFDVVGFTGNTFSQPRAVVWQRTGNLHVVCYNPGSTSTDTMLIFSGVTETTSPNKQGGLPATSRSDLCALAASDHWLFAWGTVQIIGSGKGRVHAYNEQGGWHGLHDSTTGATEVIGGGYGGGTLLVMQFDNANYEYAVPDQSDIPLNAVGRTYRTGVTQWHEFAFTDGGTPLINKLADWLTLDAHKMDGTLGLDTTCTLDAQYKVEGDTAWTALGSQLTSATTFPAIIPFNSGFGLTFKDIKLRLGLTSGTAAKTPVVQSMALAYIRNPPHRYAYRFTVDLTRHRWGMDPLPGYGGQTIYQLRDTLDGYTAPGTLVTLKYGGAAESPAGPGGRTVLNCEVLMDGQEDPGDGSGEYLITMVDRTPPASG